MRPRIKQQGMELLNSFFTCGRRPMGIRKPHLLVHISHLYRGLIPQLACLMICGLRIKGERKGYVIKRAKRKKGGTRRKRKRNDVLRVLQLEIQCIQYCM
jgi:hypothetical protein